ncbi:hypothetical protein GCM10010170_100230 [Dactylosporangium salmoneum]|uniref:Uncharacterized protein n=2 Tax=Dactylosporangium salmoneum TaxID=53361 RepID=A0ABN3HVS5_9ACTN
MRGWRGAGVLAGLVAGAVVMQTGGSLGRGALFAAPAFSACVLAGVLGGELSVRPAGGPVRTAAVEVRRARDYLPRGLTRVVATAAAVLAVLLVATTAAGNADDMGRPGRMLWVACGPDVREGRGPWPGSYYSVPLAIVVLAGLVAAGAVLHRIAARPRVGDDDTTRRRSARAVIAAVGIMVALPAAGVSAVAGGAIIGTSCLPDAGGQALLALAAAQTLLLAWCGAALLIPAPARAGSRPA